MLVCSRAWRPAGTFAVGASPRLSFLRSPASPGSLPRSRWLHWRRSLVRSSVFASGRSAESVTDSSAQGRYESARRLATVLQIFHPTAELRDQVRIFRTLEMRHGASVDVPSEITSQDRHQRLRGAPAGPVLILLNVAVFLHRTLARSIGQSSNATSPRLARLFRRSSKRRVLATVHRAFSAFRFCPSRVQSFRALRARSAVGTNYRHNPIRDLLPDFRNRVDRRSGLVDSVKDRATEPSW